MLLVRDGDNIALLDDQWALVESGTEELSTYLALAASMGVDLDTRIWEQIAAALATIEYDEPGTSGHAGASPPSSRIATPSSPGTSMR
jgi:hypothetical protein